MKMKKIKGMKLTLSMIKITLKIEWKGDKCVNKIMILCVSELKMKD